MCNVGEGSVGRDRALWVSRVRAGGVSQCRANRGDAENVVWVGHVRRGGGGGGGGVGAGQGPTARVHSSAYIRYTGDVGHAANKGKIWTACGASRCLHQHRALAVRRQQHGWV